MKTKVKENQKGITLIALVITIIVLLILASVSIAMLTGDNGILTQAKKAQEKTEIASEIESINMMVMALIKNNGKLEIKEQELQNQLNSDLGLGKTEVLLAGEEYEIIFKESNRYYTIDKNGNIIDAQEIIEDKKPGDITTGKNGEKLDGSEMHPYEIWNIEDLIVLSNMTNGNGIKFENGKPIEVTKQNNFKDKYIKLNRNLNFKSKLSYANSERIDFGDINGNLADGNKLIEEMTTGSGFIPIGKTLQTQFCGNFEGNYFEIKEIYINGIESIGLFGYVSDGNIRNLGLHGKIEGRSIIPESLERGIGGIIGEIRGKNNIIENCWNNTEIKGKLEGNYKGIGGIIGMGSGAANIINCYNTGKILAEERPENAQGCGGILGYVRGGNADVNILNCYNSGKIESNKRSAGIVGGIWAEGSINIENTFNAGNSDRGILAYRYTDNNVSSKNCYYLNNMQETLIKAEAISKEKLSSKEFVDILNDYIIKGNKIDWKKWTIGEKGYPIFQ